jgi:hypothetical protein
MREIEVESFCDRDGLVEEFGVRDARNQPSMNGMNADRPDGAGSSERRGATQGRWLEPALLLKRTAEHKAATYIRLWV